MSRKGFHLLLKKYLDGTCSPQERELIDQWYELLHEEGLLTKEENNLSVIEDRIWQKIQDNIAIQSPVIQPKKKKLFALPTVYKWVAAAFIIIIAGTAFYMSKYTQHKAVSSSITHLPQSSAFYTKTNNTTTVMPVVLADSSVVQLQPGAAVSYPKTFTANKREVYLEGAALFKVTKNPVRPFLVYSGTIVTQVLGTSFMVKKVNNRFEVAVLTGKVAVYEEGNKQLHNKGGVVITPNEKVTYYSENHHFITSLVDNPVVVANNKDTAAVKEPFNFDETPVLRIIQQLEETYAVQIITGNEKINHCLFSGNISGQSLYSMLDIICQAIGANYEIRGTSIIITGNGCD